MVTESRSDKSLLGWADPEVATGPIAAIQQVQIFASLLQAASKSMHQIVLLTTQGRRIATLMRKIIDVTGTSNVFGRLSSNALARALRSRCFFRSALEMGRSLMQAQRRFDQPGPALTFGYIISRGSRIERRPAP